MLPALVVKLNALKSHPSLAANSRGAIKLLVTDLYETKEQKAKDIVWQTPLPSDKCQVQVMMDSEVAVFNQFAKQDRHYHAVGTEIYDILEGEMVIQVDGIIYNLNAGDMIVVNPRATHEVMPEGAEFWCRVLTINCGEANDKYIV